LNNEQDYTVTEITDASDRKSFMQNEEVDLDGETYADLRKQLLSNENRGGGEEKSEAELSDEDGEEEDLSFVEELGEGIKKVWNNALNWFLGIGGNG